MKKHIFRHKWRLILAIVIAVIGSAMSVSLAFILQIIIDAGTGKDYEKLKLGIILSVLYTIVMFAVNYLRRYFRANYIKNTMTDFKNSIFCSIINKSIEEFNDESSGKYLSMMSNDIKILERDCFENIIDLFRSISLLLFSLICIFYLSPIVSVIAIVLSLLPVLIPQLFDKKLRVGKNKYSLELEEYTSELKDVFTGIEVVKGFGIENKVKEKIQKRNIQNEKTNCTYKSWEGITLAISNALGDIMMYVVMIVSTVLAMRGSMTLGMMIAIVQLMNYVMSPAFEIVESVVKMKSVKNIAQKFNDLFTRIVVDDQHDELDPFAHNIVMQEVEFHYKNKENVLKGITAEFKYGKKYALVGSSGSGKSTLVKLLLRYFDNYKGSIQIEGIELKNVSKQSLYKSICMIHQNTIIFEDTIRNNITLYGEYSEAEILEAIEKASLSNFIEKQSNGIDTIIHENGNNLSGGEKQRFSIARALIRKTPIIVLDEATSNLDSATAFAIENAILQLQDVMIIVITHQLKQELLEKYDQILVMQDGLIEETGNFDSLIQRKQLFYSMYYIGKSKANII